MNRMPHFAMTQATKEEEVEENRSLFLKTGQGDLFEERQRITYCSISGFGICSRKFEEHWRSKTVLRDFRNTPNQLTFLRLCLTPFLVLALLDGYFRTGFVLFMVAGITDGLDGLLARVLKQRTALGQYLDPVADKLLLSTMFMVLTHLGLISWRITVLVFGRDLGILVVSAILYAAIGTRDFRPSIIGKANTLAQIIALITVLMSQFYAPTVVTTIRSAALFATVVLTVFSGLHYTWRVARRIGASAALVR
jgi:cardiolipin synthase (CMP-forming)